MNDKIGTVKALKLDRRYGFIRSDGADVFFHASALDEDLPFDEQLIERRVRFQVITSERGAKALDIRAAD